MLTRVREWFKPSVPELAPREAYRLWAENYPPHAHNLLMQVEQEAMCAALPDVDGKRVLDLGCGTGRYAMLLRERSAEPLGLDFSYEMLAQAQLQLARRLLCKGDCDDLPDIRPALGEHAHDALHERRRLACACGGLDYQRLVDGPLDRVSSTFVGCHVHNCEGV